MNGRLKTPVLIIALVILAAAAGSSVLCYIFSGSIDNTAVRTFVRTLIYRAAIGELLIVVLGVMGLLFSLQAVKNEASELSAEKNDLQTKIVLLEEELEKTRLNFSEAEEALDELKIIRESERTAFNQTREAAQKVLDQIPGLEGAGREALNILEEILNRLESLPQETLAPRDPPPDEPLNIEAVSAVAAKGTGKEWTSEISEGIRLADELKMKVHEGSVQANGSRELITAIAADVKKITDMAEAIRHISAQTNILSMNAAIESAHAGPAGVGFAVVAEEIKKLAESTGINTKQIQAEIKAITEQTRAGIKAGEVSFQTMEELGGKTEKMESLLNSLSSRKPEIAGEPVQVQDLPDSIGDFFTVKLEELKAEYRFGYERIKAELETIDHRVGELRLSLESIHNSETAPGPVTPQISNSRAVTVKEPPVTVS
jgi:methyl-accepting chemotaxis protein